MNTSTSILFLAIICCSLSCQSEDKSNAKAIVSDKSTATSSIKWVNSNDQFQMKTISKEIFNKSIERSENQLLVEKFCSKSKGYQMDTWKGLNECSWAIEKYMILQDKDRVSRTEHLLKLKLDNGNTFERGHRIEEPNNSTYYRYHKYFPKTNLYVIEVVKSDQCPIYWLINAKDGTKTELIGKPCFRADGMAMILVTGTPKNQCSNNLEYMSITQDGMLKRKWQYTAKEWTVQTECLLSQSGDQTNNYAQLKPL